MTVFRRFSNDRRSPSLLTRLLPLRGRARSVVRIVIFATAVTVLLVSTPAANASSGFTVEVSVAHKGTATKSGDAWVTATVTCSQSTYYAETFLTVTEKIHGVPVVGFLDGDVPGGCGPTPTTFQTSAGDYTNGIPLKPGHANVDLQILACPVVDGGPDYDNCTWADVTTTVLLVGHKP